MFCTSCTTIGPDHARPEMALPEQFAHTVVSADVSTPAVDALFWREFGDPVLDTLADDALDANSDLKIAFFRYNQTAALLRGADAARRPAVALDMDATYGNTANSSASRGDDSEYKAGLSVSWELDLVGRLRRTVEARGAALDAASMDRAAMQVAVLAEVARTYIGLRGTQERVRIARDALANRRQTLRIAEIRRGAGRATEFDVSRTKVQVEETLATIERLQESAGVMMHRLAVLTGRTPDALIATLGTDKPLPRLPEAPHAGTPGELLRRRPDIAAAEYRLRAATAQIGVATADLFPRFTLDALLGINTPRLLGEHSSTRLIGLGMDWTFLQNARVRSRIAAADADADVALAAYEKTVLTAMEETENGLLRNVRARAEERHLVSASGSSEDAARIARKRHAAGVIDLSDMLDAQAQTLRARDALTLARMRSIDTVIDLYRALAGGWPNRVPAPSGTGPAGSISFSPSPQPARD